jgi:parallel beta-helix repeat protein
MSRTTRILSAFAILSLAATSSILNAGPLTPPAGPVASTAKPLSEIEPRIAVNSTNTPGDAGNSFIISQPGSYYLTSNLTGANGKHGIAINSANVTLDLNGFTLIGVAGSGRGITVPNNINNLVIKNGTITAWVGGGIVTGGGGFGGTIENIHADNNASGITVNNAVIVRNCSATNNTFVGIEIYSIASVINCTASKNGSHGISVTSGATVSNCSSTQNTSNGFNSGFGGNVFINCVASQNDASGFSISSDNHITNCHAQSNGLDGIRAISRNFISGNSCIGNGVDPASGAGIRVTGSDNRIENNLCTTADRGIDIDTAGNIVLRNTCSGNTLNWEIAANNVVGPILDRTAPASAAISGNSAPSSTGTTDPNANFSY